VPSVSLPTAGKIRAMDMLASQIRERLGASR
jgi:hypothetical protein